MQAFAGQHLDLIRIEPNIILLLEYSEPDQGGTRLLQRFYISKNKEVEIKTGYSCDKSFQSKKITLQEVPRKVLDDALGWVNQQLNCLPSGRILDVLNIFKDVLILK